MQIDAATYVAARAAGFAHREAEIVAYAAQYVDDATNAGVIHFRNSEYMYSRIASAHKMLDYNNLIELANHLVWIPFHFLPGNGGLGAGEEPQDGEDGKLICLPDSPVAREMLKATLTDKRSPRALHRLGVAMHVYADTFAHQGFVGAMHRANHAKNLRSHDAETDLRILKETLWDAALRLASNTKETMQILARALKRSLLEHKSPIAYVRDFLTSGPLGHAAARTYPDLPYLVWYYDDFNGSTVTRDNPQIYVHAINMMARALRAWREGDDSMTLEDHEGLCDGDIGVAERLFRRLTSASGEARHAEWLDAIARGEFHFGPQALGYIPHGADSWKHAALGTASSRSASVECDPYTPAFLNSDWKLFHDAIQVHRSQLVHDILPRFGICAA